MENIYAYRNFKRLRTSLLLLLLFFTSNINAQSVTYLSDLNWASVSNGHGPAEKDKSNGETGSTDGNTLTLNGTTYAKGLGVHSYSEIVYNISSNYSRFICDVGVDDEVPAGSIIFQVWADGVKLYESPIKTATSASSLVDVNLIGKSELKLIVTDAGDGGAYDHGDWAGARLQAAINTTGTVTREYWTGVCGNLVSEIPLTSAPTGTTTLTSLEGPTNDIDCYGTRIRGYIVPSSTGNYTFYIAGDDYSDFFLSTNNNPDNKSKIASVPGWSNSRQWNKYPEQQSTIKSLTAGVKYYFEVLHKEGAGGDNIAVGWTGPGISTITVIAGSVLDAYNAGPTLRNPDNPMNTTAGVNYNYYEGTWDLLPNFSTLTSVEDGNTTTFDLAPRNRDDNFAFQFTGFVNVPTDGTYTFYTSSDDGSKLYIGGTEIVNNDGLHGNVEQSGTIGLKAGKHAVAVTFFERTGGEILSVSYAGPGVTKQLMPAASLSRVQGTTTDTQPPSTPTNLSSSSKTASSVDLTWNNATDNVDVTGYDVYSGSTKVNTSNITGTTYTVSGLSANTAYTFTVTAKDAAGNTSVASAPYTVTTNPVSTAPGLTENFNDNVLTGWGSSAQHKLTEVNQELKNVTAKNGWDGFTYSFSPLNISSNPYVSLKIKADRGLNVTIFVVEDLSTNPAKYASKSTFEVPASEGYHEYSFNFAGVTGVDLTKIKQLLINFNPGTEYHGTVYFEDLRIGSHAKLMPNLTKISDQQTFINAPLQTVLLRGISDNTTGTNSVSISAVSSNPALIPNPTVTYASGSTGQLTYTPVANQAGTATITVTATAPNTNAANISTFTITVEKNIAPKITDVVNVVAKAGQAKTIELTGIDDGNPNQRQSLTVTATSSNTALIANPTISYTSDHRYGSLTFTPTSGLTGTSTITLKIKDNGGTVGGGVDEFTDTFVVSVYPAVNNQPTADEIGTFVMLQNAAQQTLLLTGIDDGDAGTTQNLTITAVSSKPSVIANPLIVYTQGNSTAQLKITPGAQLDTVSITVTITDNGGASNNNGNQTITKQFTAIVKVVPITGFEDLFNDGILDPTWANAGEGAHLQTEANGELRIHVDKTLTNNVWAGLWFAIPNELDISANPYISIRMKTTTPPKDMLIFLWDYKDDYNTGGTVSHIVTGDYVEYYFDFTNKLQSGNGNFVDVTRLKALLFNFAPGQMYIGDFYFDDLRVGDKAHRPVVTPSVRINPIANQTVAKNSGQKTVTIGGINNGGTSNNAVALSVSSSNTSLIPTPSVSAVTNGSATLTFTPQANVTGTSTIIVTAVASGSIAAKDTFNIDVLSTDVGTSSIVSINTSTTYQVIDGFGATVLSGNPSIVIPQLNDMGMSMVRLGVIDEGLEPQNDNSNPNIINYDALNYGNYLPWELMREMKSKTTVDKYILSMWSAPSWMKRNKTLVAPGYATDNRLETHYYEEYAEYMVALINVVKERTGIELYAVSLQNEPEFNEPYPSMLVNPEEMRDLIKVVGPRLEAEGLNTKIFMAEVLPAQGHVKDYIDAINNDPIAKNYVDIVATHNYDTDGINVGGAGAQTWADIYTWAQVTPSKNLWMTETSGHANNWSGAMELAANIYTGLYYGNINGWTFWTLTVGNEAGASYGLVINEKPTSRYFSSKHYYKYIRPGAVRVSATSNNTDVLTVTFKNTDNSTATVLINKGAAKSVSLTGNLSASYQVYTSVENNYFEQVANATNNVLLPANSITTLYGTGTISALAASVDESSLRKIGNEEGSNGSDENYKVYPNPASDNVSVEITSDKAQDAEVVMSDARGAQLFKVHKELTPGVNRIEMNVAGYHKGMYYLMIKNGNERKVKKVIIN